jgi:hypothetical protein
MHIHRIGDVTVVTTTPRSMRAVTPSAHPSSLGSHHDVN